MPYPKKLLNDRETLVLDLHPHWWYFIEAAIALVASIVLGIFALAGDWPTGVKWATVVLILASAVWLVARYLRWMTTNFVVTSDRVIFRHGLFAKSGIEIPLERINSVHFTQTIIERMLGVGDLMIESGSEQGQQRFTDVRNPDRERRCCTSRWTSTRTRRTAEHVPAARRPSTSPPSWRSWRRCATVAR